MTHRQQTAVLAVPSVVLLIVVAVFIGSLL